MDFEIRPWSAEARRRADSAYMKMLRAETPDEFFCWYEVYSIWKRILQRLERLLERVDLGARLTELFSPLVPDLELKGLKAAIRAAVILEGKPGPKSRLNLIAESWRVAADAYFAASEYTERGNNDSARSRSEEADMLSRGARQTEDSAKYQYVEPKPRVLVMPVLR